MTLEDIKALTTVIEDTRVPTTMTEDIKAHTTMAEDIRVSTTRINGTRTRTAATEGSRTPTTTTEGSRTCTTTTEDLRSAWTGASTSCRWRTAGRSTRRVSRARRRPWTGERLWTAEVWVWGSTEDSSVWTANRIEDRSWALLLPNYPCRWIPTTLFDNLSEFEFVFIIL